MATICGAASIQINTDLLKDQLKTIGQQKHCQGTLFVNVCRCKIGQYSATVTRVQADSSDGIFSHSMS